MELNGNDIFSFTKESLISTIKACNRGTLRVKVGRVKPIPMTASDRKEAARLIKKKVRRWEGTRRNGQAWSFSGLLLLLLLASERDTVRGNTI